MFNAKGVFEQTFPSPVENGPKMAVFGAKSGVKLTFLRQNPCWRLGCRRFQEPPKMYN